MNNKADITVTILVIGVFTVCTLALISFFQANIEVSNSFVGLDSVEKMNSNLEKYTFSQQNSLKDLPEVKTDEIGRHFSEEKKTTTGWLWWKKEVTLFYIRY